MALEALDLFRAVPRSEWVNREGGDVGSSGSGRSLLRHTANYLVPALVAAQRGPAEGPVVDVGGGVGAFGTWLARRLDAPLVLADHDPAVRTAAAAAFPGITTVADTSEVPTGSARLVCAMEVIEHLPPGDQVAFCAELARMAGPGGLIALSTPDERGFTGGWSGYAPHIGVVDAERLTAVLRDGTGLEPVVWRLDGEPFAIGGLERYLTPLANRAWTLTARTAPALERWVNGRVSAVATKLRGWQDGGAPALHGTVTVRPATEGSGSGLLALLTVPG